MKNKSLWISFSVLAALLTSGCSTSQAPIPLNDAQASHKEASIFAKEESAKLQQLKLLTQKPDTPIESKYRVIESQMLKKNSQYAEDHITDALIENKRNDEFSSKPLFQEPLFAKVEIMHYESEDGIYHEQQSVWIKAKEGEIVIKSNEPYNEVVDSHKSVLEK